MSITCWPEPVPASTLITGMPAPEAMQLMSDDRGVREALEICMHCRESRSVIRTDIDATETHDC